MPFPLIKLGSLFLKQVSKPLTNAIKRKAKSSPAFRKFCTMPATFYHIFDVNVKRKLLGLKPSENVQPLNEEAAVELGANMLGEAFLYSFLVGLLIAENAYSSSVSEAKEEKKRQYLQSLEKKIGELELAMATQDAEVRELNRTLGSLQSDHDTLKLKVLSNRAFK